nr:hypothetical protein [uncultured Psychroserpens sp.]
MKKLSFLFVLMLFVCVSCQNEDTNQAPVIKSKRFSLNLDAQQRTSESQSIGFIEAYDSDGDELSFFILEQSIENAISVNENSGELFLNDCCDSGAGGVIEIIELRVRVSDGQNNTEDFIILDLEED